MRLTEDSLRAALKATGDEFPAHRLPDLVLPSGRASARLRARTANGRRWLAAAAAVIAVLAIVAASLLLASVARPVRPANPLIHLPAYFVALQENPACICDPHEPKGFQNNPDRALIRSRLTGRTIATVRVPREFGTFAAVTAAGDDQTFVLAAQKLSHMGDDPYPATSFFRLRIYPAASPGHRAVLTRLAVPPLPVGRAPIGIALSPDGTKLALISAQVPGVANHPVRLQVFDLANSTHRTWGLPDSARASMNTEPGWPQWAADSRTLAISLHDYVVPALASSRQPVPGIYVALLDTDAPGSGFAADVTTVPLQLYRAGQPIPATLVDSVVVAPDGQHVLESTAVRALNTGADAKAGGLRLLNLRTHAARVLARAGYAGLGVMWSNADGSIVAAWTGEQSRSEPTPAWVFTAHGRWRIWLPAATLAVAW
jgi:hypothetical protein